MQIDDKDSWESRKAAHVDPEQVSLGYAMGGSYTWRKDTCKEGDLATDGQVQVIRQGELSSEEPSCHNYVLR